MDLFITPKGENKTLYKIFCKPLYKTGSNIKFELRDSYGVNAKEIELGQDSVL
jgi:hypothetical protein